MNARKNTRLTFARRLEMVQDITQRGMTQAAAAQRQNVSVPTVRKWLGRYLAQGAVALRDRSSRPRLSPRTIAPPRRWRSLRCAGTGSPKRVSRPALGCRRVPLDACLPGPACRI